MEIYYPYIAGQFLPTDQELPVTNPYTGDTFALTYRAGQAELDSAIQAAEAVKHRLETWPTYQRFTALRQISNEMRRLREHLATILSMESGKPWLHALAEIDRAAQTFLVAAEECKRLPGEFMSLDWTEPGRGKEGVVKYFPIGLVAGISPFNFPMNLAVHKIAPAIASGCPIVLKPASATPLSTLALAKIIDQTDLPKGAVSILPMDREGGNRLVTDERFALLSFTGSPVVGWRMKAEAGKKKVVLELGGNAAVIVTPSANLKRAMERCLLGAFAYSGQVCIHVQRLYVHDSIFNSFTKKLVTRSQSLKVGDPLDPATEFSSMIDEENARRIETWVNEAVAGGARVLTGGKRKANYYAPTILTDTSPDMKICAEEAFAPIVVVERYRDFDEAIDLVNNSVFGLQAGVFTNDLSETHRAWNNLEVGGVIVNDIPTFRADHMPYGGIKESGLGREGVKYAMLDMMEPRLLVWHHEVEEA